MKKTLITICLFVSCLGGVANAQLIKNHNLNLGIAVNKNLMPVYLGDDYFLNDWLSITLETEYNTYKTHDLLNKDVELGTQILKLLNGQKVGEVSDSKWVRHHELATNIGLNIHFSKFLNLPKNIDLYAGGGAVYLMQFSMDASKGFWKVFSAKYDGGSWYGDADLGARWFITPKFGINTQLNFRNLREVACRAGLTFRITK